jgi:flagellar protein FliS
MLYERAMADLQRAMVAIEAHDIEGRTRHLNHLFNVIGELEGSLDFERGGQVARNLARFYQYARRQAFSAAVKNSKEILSELSGYFSTLRDAWREGERRLTAQGTSFPTDARSPRKDWSDAGTIGLSVFD